MKKVALIGATGYVGRALLKELLDRGHEVKAIARHPEKLAIEHPHLSLTALDVEDGPALTEACRGCDAVISAYNPGWANPSIYEDTLRVYPEILAAVKASGVPRLLIVGGAGSLFVKPGIRLMDTGTLPEAWMPGVTALARFYLDTLTQESGIDWVFLSPAANLGNLKAGIRTGRYRTGKDNLLLDEKGDSFISVEDYAVAMVDELEQANHHCERFTVAY